MSNSAKHAVLAPLLGVFFLLSDAMTMVKMSCQFGYLTRCFLDSSDTVSRQYFAFLLTRHGLKTTKIKKGQNSNNENNIQVTKQLKFHSSVLMATKSCSREVTSALTQTDENVKSRSDNCIDTNWWHRKHRLSWHNDKLFPLQAEGTIYKHLKFFSQRAIMSSTWRQRVRNET
jgi:hypothetical protein